MQRCAGEGIIGRHSNQSPLSSDQLVKTVCTKVTIGQVCILAENVRLQTFKAL